MLFLAIVYRYRRGADQSIANAPACCQGVFRVAPHSRRTIRPRPALLLPRRKQDARAAAVLCAPVVASFLLRCPGVLGYDQQRIDLFRR